MVQTVKIIYGVGVVDKITELLAEAKYKKPFIVYDNGVKAAGIADKLLKFLDVGDIEYVCFDKVMPDPPASIIDEGASKCREEKCDAVIGMGGGSSIDTAKGINILRFNEGSILDFVDPNIKMNPSKGFIAIPTTAGTGSEVSDGIIVTDEVARKKRPILCAEGIAEYAIIDPELTIGMPPHLTASTGVDVLTHSVEAYTSNLANLFTDQITSKNIETVIKWLPLAYENGKNIEARSAMSVAATIGGWMLGNAHAHIGHAIAHSIGGKFNIPHGYACAYALPYAIEFISPEAPEKCKYVAELLGAKFTGGETPAEIGKVLRDKLIEFNNLLGIKRAKEFNYDKNIFPEVAKDIVNEVHQNFSMRKMTVNDAMNVLNKIFDLI